MKRLKATVFSAIAASLLASGAFFLVIVCLPLINPVIVRHDQPHTFGYYLGGGSLALALLGAAWYFNLKALRLRGEIK